MNAVKLSKRLCQKGILLVGLLAVLLGSSLTFAATGGDNVILRKTYSGNIDYVANGASFRLDPNDTDACSFPTAPMSSTVSIDIPVGADVIDAYLYFAGSAEGLTINLDTQSLTLNGIPLNVSAGFNEIDYIELEDVVRDGIDFFGARRDVSSIVTGPGAYTFAGLDVSQTAFRATNQTCLGAWGLVVIYEDTSIAQIRVINLFDGFQFYQNDTFDLQPRNFVVDSVTPAGKMTHFSYEGDETLATAGEQFLFSPDSMTFTPLPDPPPASGSGLPNSVDNQYDSTVTGPSPFFNRADEWGLDIDTYSLDGLLSGGDFEAITRYNTGQDLVILMAEVIQIDNKPLADIEVTLNDIGTFQTGTTNSAQYLISVQNNGDGIVGSTTAFAEGFMHVYNTLPAGISIDSLGDITAPGWDCTDTLLDPTNQVLCTYDLSSLSDSNGNFIGDLNPGESLPDILITVDIATPASPVTSIAYVTNCGNDPDTCTTFDNKHNDSTQFDPINFFESTEDLFDIVAKSGVNNNVDAEVTPIVTGIPSDLSTSTKSVAGGTNGTVQPGDVLTYTITLTESSGVTDALNVTLTDTIDPDTNNYVFGSNTCGGGSGTFSVGVLTLPGNTVTAGTSCVVTFNVTVPISANTSTSIDNTADITSTNGVGATPAAPTLLVAGVATGSKIVYFDALGGSPILTRNAPSSDSTITLANGASTTLTLSPVLTSALQINGGITPVSLWVEASANASDYSVTVTFDTPVSAPSSDTLSGVTMTSGSGNAQLFPLQITNGTINLLTGQAPTLQITNNSPNNITLHALLNSIDSKAVIDAEDVINVDSVLFFSDLLRTIPVITPGTIDAGETIYIEATISDPFGFEDITDARLTLIDPNLANQLTNVGMGTEVASTAGTKTYAYAYSIPDATSIGPGIWVAQVTGLEGNEGTVTHTEVNNFTTAAPSVSVAYTVDKLTAIPEETLTYTITITNGGGSTSLDISQLIPIGTNNVSVITLPSGSAALTGGTTLDIQNINAGTGTTVVEFTVDVLGGAQPGDLIDHTISLDNMGTIVQDIAPSVLISPFGFASGNKPIYADALNTAPRFDRTEPTTDTTTTIASQGGSQLFTMSPVLQSALTLDAGDLTASIWVSRGNSSFAGQRIVEATLGYNGALNGTIGTDSVTIQLAGGAPNAQYLPFTFNLGSDLDLPANTSLTLTITNDTTITGETITVHSLLSSEASLISLNASSPLNPLSPLTITVIEYFTDSVDSAGVAITEAAPGETIWVRATVSDPFGRDDITGATLTIEDPNALETLAATSMNVPTTQPASTAEKYFELSHLLSAELGDWTTTVTAVEGAEGVVSETDSATINVNNNVPDLTDSFKIVSNTTTADNNNNNPGDTLHYAIELINSGLAAATGVDVTDNIPTNTSFVSGTFTIDTVVQTDPGDPITLTGLTVAAGSTVTIEFDVTIDGGTTVGSLISNSALIESDDNADITVNAEDLLLAGPPAVGTKLFYLENLNSSAIITRVEPQTKDDIDFVFLDNAGGSVTMDLDVPLRKDISIDPVDGDIIVTLRVEGSNANNRNRNTTVTLGYQNGGPFTTIGSQTRFIRLFTNNITTEVFTIPVSSVINIPTGNQLQLTVTNNHAGNRDINLYSYDEEGDSVRSRVALVPSPVINVDEISFWTDTMGAGTQVTNVNPTVATDIYAKVVISDPFGEADIQAPDAATNPTTIVITDPDTSATNEGINTACTAPCYAYDGEDTINDVAGDATRTFYFIVRLTATPPATRGTWTAQVTANEGLEGDIFHVAADDFTTSLDANLSTSTKTHDAVGDIGIGDIVTYTITLNNTGGVDADNVTFSDTLQTTPVELTFNSASTTCTDELAAALPSPAFSAGDVTLSNISVTAASSCTITLSVTVGAGTAGQLINNSANIVNPSGAGATPAAPTIIYLESQIPIAGNKQLYLDNLDSGTRNLTRTQPTSTTQVTIASQDNSLTIDLAAPTTRIMELANGSIAVSLYLSESGAGANRQTYVELFVDPDGGGALPFQSIDSEQQNLNLTGTPSKRTLSLTYAPGSGLPLSLGVGAIFRLFIENRTNQAGRDLIVNSDFGGSYSELVMPLINPIEVTELKFYDASATDTGAGAASCEVTFSCGAEIDPGIVVTGSTIWARTTIADGFGAFDVNTGSQNCDGVTVDNCPTITVTDPSSGSNVFNMVFVNAPDTSSRQYEYEVNPTGFGLEGIWQVEVEGSEGIEGVVLDTAVNTFERFGQPTLTIVKLVEGLATTTKSPNTIASYTNNVSNTGLGPATGVVLTNLMGDFVDLELVNSGGTWTALFSLSGLYTVATETFSTDGSNFAYDPNTTGICTLPTASPCYDPAITHWRILLNENIPIGDSLTQGYRARIE